MPIDKRFLSQLRKVSIIEGFSTLILFFVAMPLKYLYSMPMAVSICGSIHGLLFILLVGMFFIAQQKVPISKGLMLAGIFGAVIPFGPFFIDAQLKKLSFA